ncbi:MAG: hypothetical protein CM15mV8_2050 [Caudoviricetes sp.]|nr:MAG: hypothetical protein CM15mV8_2050 [Caudoviricetes sp.]
MFWHNTNDDEEITLKAGSTLAQYILITKEETLILHKLKN